MYKGERGRPPEPFFWGGGTHNMSTDSLAGSGKMEGKESRKKGTEKGKGQVSILEVLFSFLQS